MVRFISIVPQLYRQTQDETASVQKVHRDELLICQTVSGLHGPLLSTRDQICFELSVILSPTLHEKAQYTDHHVSFRLPVPYVPLFIPKGVGVPNIYRVHKRL